MSVAAAAWLPSDCLEAVGGLPAAIVRLEGIARSVAEREDRLAAMAGTAHVTFAGAESRAIWHAVANADFVPPECDVWRVSVPPRAGAALIRLETVEWGCLDWGGGLAWLATRDQEDAGAAAIRKVVASHGGHATLIRAGRELRQRVAPFEPATPGLAALSLRIRQSFDPAGILNPGRMG